jgi:hypothetical protein
MKVRGVHHPTPGAVLRYYRTVPELYSMGTPLRGDLSRGVTRSAVSRAQWESGGGQYCGQVLAQMWAGPGADVGRSWCRCGQVVAQMWLATQRHPTALLRRWVEVTPQQPRLWRLPLVRRGASHAARLTGTHGRSGPVPPRPQHPCRRCLRWTGRATGTRRAQSAASPRPTPSNGSAARWQRHGSHSAPTLLFPPRSALPHPLTPAPPQPPPRPFPFTFPPPLPHTAPHVACYMMRALACRCVPCSC